jgi:hypothetical protein
LTKHIDKKILDSLGLDGCEVRLIWNREFYITKWTCLFIFSEKSRTWKRKFYESNIVNVYRVGSDIIVFLANGKIETYGHPVGTYLPSLMSQSTLIGVNQTGEKSFMFVLENPTRNIHLDIENGDIYQYHIG